jgi:hypothetical protein
MMKRNTVCKKNSSSKPVYQLAPIKSRSPTHNVLYLHLGVVKLYSIMVTRCSSFKKENGTITVLKKACLKEPEVMERKHAQFYILEKIIISCWDVNDNE